MSNIFVWLMLYCVNYGCAIQSSFFSDQEPDLMRGESEMNGGSSNQQFDVKLRQKKVNNNERNSNTGDVICSAMLNSNLEIVSQPSSHPITEFSSKTSGHTYVAHSRMNFGNKFKKLEILEA